MFGVGTFKRPWQRSGDPMEVAIGKAEAAFEFFSKLGIDYYSFHDTDVAPEGSSLKEYRNHFAQMVDHLERHQEQTGIKLLWALPIASATRVLRQMLPVTPTRKCLPWRPPRCSVR